MTTAVQALPTWRVPDPGHGTAVAGTYWSDRIQPLDTEGRPIDCTGCTAEVAVTQAGAAVLTMQTACDATGVRVWAISTATAPLVRADIDRTGIRECHVSAVLVLATGERVPLLDPRQTLTIIGRYQ